jgi:shikimate kinase
LAKDSEQLQKDGADKERLEKLYQKAQEELDSVNKLNVTLKSQLEAGAGLKDQLAQLVEVI